MNGPSSQPSPAFEVGRRSSTGNVVQWIKKRRIGVLLGGCSAEREISLKTGNAVYASLQRQGFPAVRIDAQKNLPEQLRRARVDFAFIALHGPGGEDGVVQGLLEWLGIPYTGSGVLASALAMDKVASRKLFAAAGLPVAQGFAVQRSDPRPVQQRLAYPIVVKPSTQGSAIGVSVVRSARAWPQALQVGFKYDATLVVEKYLEGVEITIGVLGAQTLPIIEILPVAGAFYDFQSKYAPGGSRHILPARISNAQAVRSAQLARAACAALGTRGAARVDLIVDKRWGPTLLEVNTIPGMTETSLLPEAARAAGLDFDALVRRIMAEAHG